MKKGWILLCITLLMTVNTLHSEDSGPIDLLVVMDTSASMYESFKEVSQYAIGPLLGDFLHIGDTFHLISFSDAPKLELSRRIEGVGDVETIISRLLLMYPLNPYSDIIAVLEYTARYLSDLPEFRQKTVVFISDGEHAPSASSPYAVLSEEAVHDRLAESAQKIKNNGWNFHFIRMPQDQPQETSTSSLEDKSGNVLSVPDEPTVVSDGDEKAVEPGDRPSPPGTDVSETVSELLHVPMVEWEGGEGAAETLRDVLGTLSVAFPENIGKTGRSIKIPLRVYNPSQSPVYLETRSILVDSIDRMARRSFKKLAPRSESTLILYIELPEDIPASSMTMLVEPRFADSIRIHPLSGNIALELSDSSFMDVLKGLYPLLLFIVILILVILLIFIIVVLVRQLHRGPQQVAADTALRPSREPKTAALKAPVSVVQREGLQNSHTTAPAEAKRDDRQRIHTEPLVQIAASTSTSDAELLAQFAAQTREPTVIVPRITAKGQEKSDKSLDTLYSPNLPYELKNSQERIMLSLFVEDQNTAIGKRNIHLIKAGKTFTIGGGRSDFLIFLVPLPYRIADLRFDGESCMILPRRPEYFPDTGREPIRNCIGKRLRLLSDKGYELHIRMDRYRDPLESLNRFLHSIELPG